MVTFVKNLLLKRAERRELERLGAEVKAAIGDGDVKSFFGGGVQWHANIPYHFASKEATLNNNTIIQGCLGWICRNFLEPSGMVATYSTTGDIEKDYGHPLAILMRDAGPGKMTGRRLAKALLASYYLDGNAYAEIIWDRRGFPAELVFIPPSAISPIAEDNDANVLKEYRVSMRGRKVKNLKPKDVLHIADGIDSNDPLKGCSALKTCMRMVMTDDEANAYIDNVIRNIDAIGLLVTPVGDKRIEDKDRDFLESKIKSKHGKLNQGATMVASGEVKVQYLGIDPSKLDLKVIHRIPEERISAIFGVAAIVVGLGAGLDRSTFANFEEARKAATEQLLMPLWAEFAEQYTKQLGKFYDLSPNQVYLFDTSKVRVLQEDENKRWDRVGKAYTNGGLTRGEYRTAIGYEAVKGRDEEFYQDPIAGDPQKMLRREINERSKERRRTYDAIHEGADDSAA